MLKENKEVRQKLSQIYDKSSLETYREELYLNLNDPQNNLVDLEEMERDAPEFAKYREKFSKIITLNVSNNSLTILSLKNYNFLDKIVAQKNLITKVELVLQKLKYINLSNNMLTKIFELNSLPSLETLNLSQNAITHIHYEDFRPVKFVLKTVILDYNKIIFDTIKDFCDFCEVFGKNVKGIKAFGIQMNPFTFESIYADYTSYILASFNNPDFTILNGATIDKDKIKTKDIKDLRTRIMLKEKEDPKKNENKKQRGGKGRSKAGVNLSIINNEMAKYSTLGKLNQESLHSLFELIDSYINSGANFEKDEESESQYEDSELEEFENFLEYSNILIDSSPSLEKKIFEIVADFTHIKAAKFAHLILSFLKQQFSPNKAQDITDVLKHKILEPVISSPDSAGVSPSLIKGLESFLLESKFFGLMKQFLLKILKILIIFKDISILGGNKNAQENRNKEIFCMCISFLSTASQSDDYLEIIVKDDKVLEVFANQIRILINEKEEILNKDVKALEILSKLLNLIKENCLFRHNVEEIDQDFENSIDKLIGGGLRDKIENVLREKFVDLADEEIQLNNEKLSVEVIVFKQTIFGNMIRCYGALLMKTKDKSVITIRENSVTIKILNILVQMTNSDPLVISAACDFCNYLMNNKKYLKNEDRLFDNCLNKLYSLRQVLPYLFYEKEHYKNACAVAERYGQNTIRQGKPVKFYDLTSEIMQQMFISIIKLIGFFGKYSKKEGPINKSCNTILNDMATLKRDTALCLVLEVPSEDCTLASVECLYNMRCQDFTSDEIGWIYKKVSNVNLIGGKIELIVGIIYLILSKCFKYLIQNNNREKLEQNKEAISLANELLLKNQERNIYYDYEYKIKQKLNLCLINFLYLCSGCEILKKTFLERKNTQNVPLILHYEMKNVHKEFGIPIEIERTRSGMNIHKMLSCIKSNHNLRPYNYVTLRLFIDMANLLMNVPTMGYKIDDSCDYEELIKMSTIEIIKRECARISSEARVFKKFDLEKLKGETFKEREKNFVVSLTQTDLKDEQKMFLNIFPTFLTFLIGSNDRNDVNITAAYYEEIWDDKFDKKLKPFDIDELNEEQQQENLDELDNEIDFPEDIDPKEKKEKIDEKSNMNANENESVYEKYKHFLRISNYFDQQSHEKRMFNEYDNIMKDIFPSMYGVNGNIERSIEDETPNNPRLRVYIMSAFLRCIYALIVYPAEGEIKNEMIKILLKDDNILTISKLCDSTKLQDCNIASKYLTIMRFVVMDARKVMVEEEKADSKKKTAEETTTGGNPDEDEFINSEQYIKEKKYLSKLGIISYMYKKIIRIFKNDLDIKKNEDRILLSELSKFAGILLGELQTFSYRKDLEREAVIEAMISFDSIRNLLLKVREFMNIDSLKFKGVVKQSTDEEREGNAILAEMSSTISDILGDYMSKCKKKKYKILEILTRSYIFDNVNLRKSYIQDIIDKSKDEDLKNVMEKQLGFRIHGLSRCYLIDHTSLYDNIKILIINNFGLQFIDVGNLLEDHRSIWKLKDYKINEEFNIQYSDIEFIYTFNLQNRIILRLKENKFVTLQFIKTLFTHKLIDFIKFNNVQILNNMKEIELFNFKKEYSYPVADADGDEKEEEDKLGGNTEQDEKPFPFFCAINTPSFFDFLKDMFQKKKEIMCKDNKVAVIYGSGSLIVYEENYEAWKTLDLKKIFNARIFKEAPFNECFTEVKEFDLNNLDVARYVEADLVKIFFYNDYLEIRLIGDHIFNLVKIVLYKYGKDKDLIEYPDEYDFIK